MGNNVATPFWPSVGVKPNTPKVGDLESSGTLKRLEFDRKAQNTWHWDVIGVIGKVLKRRYRKWPCIGHLDICSPNYGQKKGRKSNWQFDSRALKVGNRPLPNIWFESATWRLRDLDKGWFKSHHNWTLQLGVVSSQSPGTPIGTISRLQLGTLKWIQFSSLTVCTTSRSTYSWSTSHSQNLWSSPWYLLNRFFPMCSMRS
jgi:hypothetical protein